ncbi:MAG: hypothetical protein AAGG44_04520 [Planctomycetota bacterium]
MAKPSPPNRRSFLQYGTTLAGAALAGSSLLTGCRGEQSDGKQPNLMWGRFGRSEGRFSKPRAMVIAPNDELYIVDKKAWIQVFDPNDAEVERHRGKKISEGKYIRGWQTPAYQQGKPTGLGWSNDGHLMVADTHYYRVLFYTADGEKVEERTIGGEFGDDPAQFHFVTDVVQDQRDHFFVGQYGQIDQIQEFGNDGEFIRRWGSQGRGQEEFSRPQALHIDSVGLLWIADACNHRIQVYEVDSESPKLVQCWGEAGSLPGQLKYPYGMDFDHDGTLLIAEFGNHRVQRFSRDGKSLEVFGSAGKEPGQFIDPWALIIDSKRNLHVLDTGNNRIQRFPLS